MKLWDHTGLMILKIIFFKLCKRFLGVKANCNNMVYIELKCLSFRSVRIIRMIKYWIKLLGTTNCILKPCYVNFTKDCKAKRSCSNLAVFINYPFQIFTDLTSEIEKHQIHLQNESCQFTCIQSALLNLLDLDVVFKR